MKAYYTPFDKQTTSDGSVNSIPLRGAGASVRIAATGANAHYVFAPSASGAVVAAVTGVRVAVADSMYLLKMTAANRNKFHYGMVIELQNAADSVTAVGVVTDSQTDGLQFSETEVPVRIITQTATDATSSAANVADTTKVVWADPAAATVGVLLEVGEPHCVCPPFWATNGVIKFVREASTNATVHIDSVL